MRPVPYTWTQKDVVHATIPRPNPYPTDGAGINKDLNERGLSPFLFLPETLPGCRQHRPGEIVWLRLQRSPMPYTVLRYTKYDDDVEWQVAPEAAKGATTLGELCTKMLALSADPAFKDRAKYAGLYDEYNGSEAKKDELALKIFEHWENTGNRYVITRADGWSWTLVQTPQKLPTKAGAVALRWRVPTRVPVSSAQPAPVVPEKPAVIKVPTFPQPFTGCTPTQRDAVKIALQAALDDLDKAIAELGKMTTHAKDALWLAFRDNSQGAATDAIADLKKVRAGLPTANICCEQKGMGKCTNDNGEVTAGYGEATGIGSIHLCVGSIGPERYVWTLIHEGAHRFASKLSRPFDIYYDPPQGDESDDTSGALPWLRKMAADSLAAVTYHLAHRTPAEAEEQVRLYKGELTSQLVQGFPHGTIDLDSKPKQPIFIVAKVPPGGVFSGEWYMIDTSGNVYPMESTGPVEAIIPKETRDQLRAAGVGYAEVRCNVTIEQVDAPCCRSSWLMAS